jgi:DtxR family Mn-dependent transcriptional regulator
MRPKTVEEYCRAIDKMDRGEGVRSKDLCGALGLSKNTVALTLQKLILAGYVSMERYGRVSLTADGGEVARRMNFRHRVLETFLFDKLGMDREKVHGEADALEHAASDEMVRRLYDFIGRPKKDPHGKEI